MRTENSSLKPSLYIRSPFFAGQQCNIKCPYGSYGQDCRERCKCQNGGSCDHVSGACSCPAGWRGALWVLKRLELQVLCLNAWDRRKTAESKSKEWIGQSGLLKSRKCVKLSKGSRGGEGERSLSIILSFFICPTHFRRNPFQLFN